MFRIITFTLFSFLLLSSCEKNIDNSFDISKEVSGNNKVEQRIKMIHGFNGKFKETQSRTDDSFVFEDMAINDFIDFISDVINYNFGVSPLDLNDVVKTNFQVELNVVDDTVSIDKGIEIYNSVLEAVSNTFYSNRSHEEDFSFIELKYENNIVAIELYTGNSKNNFSNNTETRTRTDYFYNGQLLQLHEGFDTCSRNCNDLTKCVYTSEKIRMKAYNNYWNGRYLPAGGTWILKKTESMSSRKVPGWWSGWITDPIPCAGYIELNGYVDAGTDWLFAKESSLGYRCFYTELFDGQYPEWNGYSTYRFYWVGLARCGEYVINPTPGLIPEF